jgi:two-component system response regulator GlrR
MNAPHPFSRTPSSTRPPLHLTLGLGQLVGDSSAFVVALSQVPTVAKFDIPALILGETGTGKEMFARAIHYHSRRSAKPFVPVNCGAIPTDLVENEFFGHSPGAFTGANACHRGLIKLAEGGTLFLDEIDSLPVAAQVKLLRFLQDGQFRPLGHEGFLAADVRILAATNAELNESIRSGRFRQDLFFRLNVVSLKLPALREREDDVFLLAHHFLSHCHLRYGGDPKSFSAAALQRLAAYDWPGNVRELENVVQRAFILATDEIIEAQDISVGHAPAGSESMTFHELKSKMVKEFEQTYIRRSLRLHGGNITQAARSAGKDRRAFWELMRKHRILPELASRAGLPEAGQTTAARGQFYPARDLLTTPAEPALAACNQARLVRGGREGGVQDKNLRSGTQCA